MAQPPHDDPDQHLLDFIPERFDADADSHQAKRGAQGRLFLSIALGLAAIVATVVTIWYIFANQSAATSKDGVPLVLAEQGPVKTKPVEPGGMEVPNQDKLVYERLGREAPAQAERLLPPPEQPKAPPAAPAQAAPSLATPKPKIEALAPVEPPPTLAAEPPAQVVAEPAPPPAPATKPAEPPQEQKVAVAPPAPPPAAKAPAPAPVPAAASAPPAVKATKNGAWLIQIAAMRDSDAAQKEWSRVQTANRDLMGALSPDIVRADLGARGVFWRVRGGPLDEAAARRLCDELGKRKIGCMVVRK